MSETIQGVLIGGLFGFLGALIGILATIWLERRKSKETRIGEARLRLVGERIQTSEVMSVIKAQRTMKWPLFRKREPPDLSRANLKEIDLRGQDLHGIVLFRANLENADLDGADLRQADLSKAILRNANLSSAKLDGATFNEADLEKANLEHVSLIGASLKKANLKGSNIKNADLQKVNLSKADVSGCNLSKSNISRAMLRKTNMANVNLNQAILENTNLESAILNEAQLFFANLRNANLIGATLCKADMRQADLTNTNLSMADLTGAKLNQANLYKSCLDAASLQEANLQNANLSKADLRSIYNKIGNDLEEGVGAILEGTNLKNVYYDAETRWPRGFTPSEEAIKFEGGSIWPEWPVSGIFGRDSKGTLVTVLRGKEFDKWILVRGENRKIWLDVILRRDGHTGQFLLYKKEGRDKKVMLKIVVVLASMTRTALLFHQHQEKLDKKTAAHIFGFLNSLTKMAP